MKANRLHRGGRARVHTQLTARPLQWLRRAGLAAPQVLAVSSDSAAPLCVAGASCVVRGGCILALTHGPGRLLGSARTEPGSVLSHCPLVPSWL